MSVALSAWRRLRHLRNRTLNRFDPPVIVLGYHRVAVKGFDPNQVAVSPANFRAQMQHLKRTCRLVRLEEDWSGVGEPAAAVTFDDGYADNLHEALPILEEVGVPATFFVSTFPLDGHPGEFWWDELERLLLGEGVYPERFRLEGGGRDLGWPTVTKEERLDLYGALHVLFLRSRPAQRDDWLRQLRAWAGREDGPVDADRLLTAEELQLLAASPWATLGAHTVTHTSLAALREGEQREEITRSREQLEKLTGRTVTTFAFPFGAREDFTETTVRLCREAGFRKAVSTLPGQAHRWTDPLRLPRQLVRNWNLETFVARLASFWT